MREPLEIENERKIQEVTAYAVRHLPIIKEYAKKIGVVEIINNMIPSEMDTDPGTVFLGLVLDTLVIKTGRTRTLNKPLTDQQKEYLNALDINPEIFVNPGG